MGDDMVLKKKIQDAWSRAPESRKDYPTMVEMAAAVKAVAIREGLLPATDAAPGGAS